MPTQRRVGAALVEGIFGIVALVSLAIENIGSYAQGHFDPLDIWSRFTYQSALIAAVALLVSAYASWRGVYWERAVILRGAATLYMIVTGVVFATLVQNASPVWGPDNNIMHQVIPIVMVVCWVIDQPPWRISYARATAWLVYPLVFAAYLQIYGKYIRSGDYIYAFMDSSGGKGLTVLATVLTLLVAASIVLWIMLRLPRHSGAKSEKCPDITGHGNRYGAHTVCATCDGKLPRNRTRRPSAVPA